MDVRFNMIEGYKIHYLYRERNAKVEYKRLDYYTENANDSLMDIELLDSHNTIEVKAITPCKFNREMLHMCEYY